MILTVVTSVFVFAGKNIADEGDVSVNSLIKTDFYKAVPYSAFAFEGVAVVLPLRDIVANQENFYKLVCIVVGGICVFYIVFCEFCNLSYGDMSEFVLITDALPVGYVGYSLKALYTVNLICSYPLQMSPAINLMEGYIFDKKASTSKGRFWAQNLVRSGMVAFTICLALIIYKQISVFIEIIAASTCAPLAFTMPALFHHKLIQKSNWKILIVVLTTALTVGMIG